MRVTTCSWNCAKPTSFSPVLAVIGVALIMFSKREKRQSVGSILVGFAVLMTGMSMMSDAVSPLKDVPEFTSMLTLFSNPFFGVLAGTIADGDYSVLLRLLWAFCRRCAPRVWLRIALALPIIMGQNIGTCVTALLSAVGASKNARRAAVMYTCTLT